MKFDLNEFLSSGSVMSVDANHVLIGWGKKKKLKHLDEIKKPTFFLTDFFLKSPDPWICYSHTIKMSVDELYKQLPHFIKQEHYEWNHRNKERFSKSFAHLKYLIEAKQLIKAVPYIFSHTASKMDKNLLTRSLKCALIEMRKTKKYLYGSWTAHTGLIGLTPELLFSYDYNKPEVVSTMALAGTSNTSICQNLFKNDIKELHEHAIVVKGIAEELQQVGEVVVGELEVIAIPPLAHLLTPIHINLKKKFVFNEVLHSLHPTYALGASPKEQGKKWLEKYQKHTQRGYYGAPIGFFCPEKNVIQLVVAIRNIQWNSNGMRIGAGCGVVSESDYSREWQEIQLKTQAVKEQFGL